MLVGVPKEIKDNENRVAMVPGGVAALVSRGHSVLVQKTAGLGSGFSDDAFIDAGAEMIDGPEAVFSRGVFEAGGVPKARRKWRSL